MKLEPDTLYAVDMKKEMSMFVNNGTRMKRFFMNNSTAVVATGTENGKKWATVYEIMTAPAHRGKGEATKLLKGIKELYEKDGYKFGLWCPMNDVIAHICEKLGVETYE